ncbi:hypothetical protein AB0N97_04230 [Streptomyces collinus]|uniref:hypothetical protein n=1 Tax=Streptomyces collinus TaxID=42684 RepID=UPI00342F4C93
MTESDGGATEAEGRRIAVLGEMLELERRVPTLRGLSRLGRERATQYGMLSATVQRSLSLAW